ncbi:MAG TPA: prepilin peptidase [Acidimicrobiales bacterium]|nr:prepilin peptidase [Acidimicrobiales bacterium]
MTAVVAVVCAVLGLAVGSFLNVVVHRVPRKESVVSPRSRCPGCGTQLAARDNVPVVSWLLLRGRCRSCGMRISPRYPVVELATAALFAAAAVRFADEAVLPAYLLFFAALLAVSAIDLEHFIVPKRIVYPALVASAPALVVAAAVGDEWDALGDAAVGGVLAWAVLFLIHLASPRGMGFGDVRLAGLIGVHLGWLGPGHVLLGLFLAFLSAAAAGLGLIAARRRTRKDKVPFGPFLALGAVVAVLAGGPILSWYGV